jgi:nitrogen regulatory protein PII
MKLIKAIVRPSVIDAVTDALSKLYVSGVTVTDVRGHGRQKGHTAVYRGQEYLVTLHPKMEIEAVVIDDVADEVVRTIIEHARTGEIGDGRVFVLPVEENYRVRTGDYLRD